MKTRTSNTRHKPSYDESLCAYQRAFEHELQQVVQHVPLTENMRILDVPCGNGFYSGLLAERLSAYGRIDCVDLCPNYVSKVRKRLRDVTCTWDVHEADAYMLPFADGTFDLVWCAQSLISLNDPLSAVREMNRVLRPGGVLAILENDIFHHILLPWPVDLEIPVQRAIQRASKERFGSSTKLAPARRIPHLLEKAVIHSYRKHTFAGDRQAPWSPKVRRMLEFHVRDLRKLIHGHLSEKAKRAFNRFVSRRHRGSLFGDEAMDLTCLNILYQARKPVTAGK